MKTGDAIAEILKREGVEWQNQDQTENGWAPQA